MAKKKNPVGEAYQAKLAEELKLMVHPGRPGPLWEALQRNRWVYQATVVRTVDGDTLDVDLDLGFSVSVRQRIRLIGVDTPEVRGPERERGLDVAIWVVQILEAADHQVLIQTVKEGKGKFGRYLGEVFIPGWSSSLNQVLVDTGQAVRYQ